MYPFLYGTIYSNSHLIRIHTPEFQLFFGTIDSKEKITKVYDAFVFQFLCGTIDVVIPIPIPRVRRLVSIPLWYD